MSHLLNAPLHYWCFVFILEKNITIIMTVSVTVISINIIVAVFIFVIIVVIVVFEILDGVVTTNR